MCLTDLNPDVQEAAEHQQPPRQGQAGHEHPGVAWGKAGDPSLHPVEDLADQVHRGLRVQEREPGHRLALPR